MDSNKNQILFATSNDSKLNQFQFVAHALRYNVTTVSAYKAFPKTKPYSEEYVTQEEIVKHGASEVFASIRKPIVVEDSIIEVEALNNLPGLRSATYLKEKGRQGLISALKNKTNKKASITSMLAFFDGTRYKVFKKRVKGIILNKERYKKGEPDWIGPSNHPFGGGYNAIFLLPKLRKTLAELTAKEGLTYGYREPNFANFLSWYLSTAKKR